MWLELLNNARTKEDDILPTGATESVLLTRIVDTKENRYITIIDIPNTFIQMHAKNKSDMEIIKLREVLMDILCRISPNYNPYVTRYKKGINQLMVPCKNSLYATMVAILLFNRKFTNNMTDIEFEINPYDPCVLNKVIGGLQMTICFHVDDCKSIHRKRKTND